MIKRLLFIVLLQVFTAASAILPYAVFAQELVQFDFKVKPNTTIDNTCVTNTATVTDESTGSQTGQTTASTQVGTGTCATTPSSSPLAQFAIDLTNGLIASCGGFVTGSNVESCALNGIPASNPYRDIVFEIIKTSVLTHGCWPSTGCYFQCVGFVAATVSGVTGDPIGIQVGGSAKNAKDGLTHKPAGTTEVWIDKSTTATILPGDFPVWDGSFGHIAVVASVEGPNNFTVAQANVPADGQVDLQSRTKDEGPLLGWVRLTLP